jgi:hypothetical protein
MSRVSGSVHRDGHGIGIREIRQYRLGAHDGSAIQRPDPPAFALEFLCHGMADDAVRADNKRDFWICWSRVHAASPFRILIISFLLPYLVHGVERDDAHGLICDIDCHHEWLI